MQWVYRQAAHCIVDIEHTIDSDDLLPLPRLARSSVIMRSEELRECGA
jgi:hypothetical protein